MRQVTELAVQCSRCVCVMTEFGGCVRCVCVALGGAVVGVCVCGGEVCVCVGGEGVVCVITCSLV